MARVREVTMDGMTLKISPLSYDEAEEYILKSKEMINRNPKPTPQEWMARTLDSTCVALNKALSPSANGDKWDVKKLTSELDTMYIFKLHSEFIEMSGLKVAAPGRASDIDFTMIRCRMVTELHKSPKEVGAFDFPFVIELLEYWSDYPPTHLLLRAMANYEGRKDDGGNWRKERAKEMGDETYRPELPQSKDEQSTLQSFSTGARKLDCAPTHIQEAVARAKRGEHLNVPGAGN